MKLQLPTYHKEHKQEEDRNKAPIPQASQPKMLRFPFP